MKNLSLYSLPYCDFVFLSKEVLLNVFTESDLRPCDYPEIHSWNLRPRKIQLSEIDSNDRI
jgi:hypothetical protein